MALTEKIECRHASIISRRNCAEIETGKILAPQKTRVLKLSNTKKPTQIKESNEILGPIKILRIREAEHTSLNHTGVVVRRWFWLCLSKMPKKKATPSHKVIIVGDGGVGLFFVSVYNLLCCYFFFVC